MTQPPSQKPVWPPAPAPTHTGEQARVPGSEVGIPDIFDDMPEYMKGAQPYMDANVLGDDEILAPTDWALEGDPVPPKDIAVYTHAAPHANTSDQPASDAQATASVQPGTKPRIGERLLNAGLINESQLQVALAEQKISGKLIGEALMELGFITSDAMSHFLARDAGLDIFDPKHTIFDTTAVALLSKAEAKAMLMLPVGFTSQNEVLVALTDPYDVVNMDRMRRKLPRGYDIKPLVTGTGTISEAIDVAYGFSSDIEAILKELDAGPDDIDLTTLSEKEIYTHPVVRLINGLLFHAVKTGVSDLHFEPEENFVRLRNRLDGVLYNAHVFHKKHWGGMAQRIKIMCNMNIADKYSPQDGRISLNVSGRLADFRVSVLPTVHGENIVMRVLDKNASILPLEDLGFSPQNLAAIKAAQQRPEGVIIVTGPTGSGKTTTLYSMLAEANSPERNIQTLEDPVEYAIPMIRQTNIREGIMDFADGIRAMLRQDPDIIFIGEIRDDITADMALKAAMTGHQVFTTLHTNDSFGAIPRLLDLELKANMLAGAVIAIMAQRLVRRLCKTCKESYQPDALECETLRLTPEDAPQLCRPKQGGCTACNHTGYKGRVAVAEVLSFDEAMDDILANGGSKSDLKAAARANGFKSMREDAILKIIAGQTSVDEVRRVVNLNKD
ncbi:MAG: ATPase, T2SS/T4P/T4SS family [Pseudomonadota bacterium]